MDIPIIPHRTSIDDGGYIHVDGFPDQSYFEGSGFVYGPSNIKYKDVDGNGKIIRLSYTAE